MPTAGMLKRLFVVVRSRGDAWVDLQPMERQHEWAAHASFMNALEKDGFVILGGPLEDTPDVLLIVRAGSQEEITARFSADPWTSKDLLRIGRIVPWTLRLGSLG